MGEVLIGTSGFSYTDWKEVFYPPEIPRGSMLSYYANHFPVVELDYTYYQMPNAKTLRSMVEKTPEGFLFCVKTHQSMTHESDASEEAFQEACHQFVQAIEPLRSAGKLACVLAQYPWGFRPQPNGYQRLRRLREALIDLPVVIEFRNIEWVQRETFYFLHDLDFGFCCVDEPKLKGLFPPLAFATSNIGYIRFHGRNAAKWWKHGEGWERYDYEYSREELLEWLPKIRKVMEKTSKTFVLMNNCHAGHAAVNARMLQDMLMELDD